MVLSEEERRIRHNIACRKYRKRNPEKSRESSRVSVKKCRDKNPEVNRKRNKEWREKNSEYNKERLKKWRTENPEKVIKQHKDWREKNPDCDRKRKKESSWLINMFLYPYECYRCKHIYDPVVLEFHHINPSIKKFEISSRYFYANTQALRLIEEILKCIIVCANCHRFIEHKKIKLGKIKNRLV